MASFKLLSLLGVLGVLLVSASALTTCAGNFSSCNAGSYQGACYSDFTSGDEYCACRSGVVGESCESAAAAGASCTFASLNTTKTEYAPLAVSVLFDDDTLNVSVSSPLVSERNYTVVAIDNSSFADERCTYPGLYWWREVRSCTDVFSGSMPWADNVACGWTVDTTSDVSFSKYSAQLVVRHHDVTAPFGSRPGSAPVERVVDHVVPLTIAFPRNVTVTSALVVQAPVKVILAVSRQNVSADGSAATIELTSNVLWPYQLTNFTLPSTPATANGASATFTPSLVSSSCPNDGASSCTQVWRIAVATNADCNLNGDFQLAWNLTCQQVSGTNPPQCAIQATDGVLAGLSTSSEDFCTVVSTVLPLTGSLASYGDAGLAQNKTQFLVGQTLFYRASVVADNITLTATTINSVKLLSPDAAQSPVILYAGLSVVSAGTAASFTTLAATANTAAFSFRLTSDFIAPIADDSARAFTAVVIVDVEYQNTVTNKRGVTSLAFTSNLNSQPVGLASAFEVSQPATVDSSSSILSLSFASILVAAFIVLFN